ncbi:dihydrodipicolinate synthase family protein [Dyadobacter psychrophilus]|uniref:4-hydroxy-tetrahydrodipicolinate synthase n=1 Tax=Dyadobacter psychrophilus TaxID=651661 RepID=A0A1T5E068_9BACT|nr:dihydrodipicolinate synthase family protein [Dyadobacter psychrophilus]SKB77381.1 4-hydroxy-tetrahydrodipicolinate synthase [Dyadobacter psychrophilus]
MKKKFSGVVVPMITPVNADLTIDLVATGTIVNYLTTHGTAPFILGTTGESASVSRIEKKKLIEATVKAVAGKSIVYAGISGNAIMDSIEDARHYHDLGADVFVATMTSYYPVDADQMLRYFIMLADNLQAPLIIYNIPATTHLSIPLDVVQRLSEHPNIVGFKDSERSAERLEMSVSLWKDRADFSFLTGWAAQSMRALQLGADGIIPSTGNLAPELYQTLLNSVADQDYLTAENAQGKADRISEVYQKDRTLSHSLPALKAMMSAYGLCQSCVLPPMFPLTVDEEKSIRNFTLSQFGDLKQINSIN